MAGFQVVRASEFVPLARETYAANWPETPLDPRDVRAVSGAEILDQLGMKVGELDLLEGSPPCAPFSEMVRKNVKAEDRWGKEVEYSGQKQRTDDLFGEFVRLVRDIRPRAFVAENVLGLVKGKGKGHFIRILEDMTAAGYRVRARLLDAAWLGVPQHRERLIFVGLRDDLGLEPEHPTPFPYQVSLAEALAGLPEDAEAKAAVSFVGFAIEETWRNLIPGKRRADKYFTLKKPKWNLPCPTVVATAGKVGGASVAHPDEPRKFTDAEFKRICGFPDDYVLVGNYEHRIERLGRAVPPPMMAAIAGRLRDQLLSKK